MEGAGHVGTKAAARMLRPEPAVEPSVSRPSHQRSGKEQSHFAAGPFDFLFSYKEENGGASRDAPVWTPTRKAEKMPPAVVTPRRAAPKVIEKRP